jgi:hypothetical protein
MQDNPAAEEKYIIRKLQETQKKKAREDFELPLGMWVRYIIPRGDKEKDKGKRRFVISPERYQIAGRAVKGYILMDKLGNVRTFPRWQLVAYDGLNLQTMTGTDFSYAKHPKSMFDYIEAYDPKEKKYLVVWKGLDGKSGTSSWETVAKVRKGYDSRQPTHLEEEWADSVGISYSELPMSRPVPAQSRPVRTSSNRPVRGPPKFGRKTRRVTGYRLLPG